MTSTNYRREAITFSTGWGLGDSMDDAQALDNLLGPGALAAAFAFGAILYVYSSACLTIIARKTNTPNGWMAWVPLLNLVLMCQCARKSAAWVLLMIIPFINIIAMCMILAGIAQARGKSGALVLLMFVPPLGLLLPAILAAGPAAGQSSGTIPAGYVPGAAPAAVPQFCPKCGTQAQPADAFCGNCGQPRAAQQPVVMAAPAAAPAPVVASSGCGVFLGILAVGGLAMLACCGGVGYYLGFPTSEYKRPERQTAALPPRLSGTLTLLPTDHATQGGLRPTSIASQRFDKKSPDDATPTVDVPSKHLPPGVSPSEIPQWSSGITSVTYRGGTPNTSNASTVHVHVFDMGGKNSSQAITASVTQGAGGKSEPIQVESPKGAKFTGSRVQTGQSTTYVLTSEPDDCVIIVYGPDPQSVPAAERLATNLGNNQGLTDPELKPLIGSLPAAQPPWLELVELRTISAQEMKASAQAMQEALNEQNAPGGREIAAQLKQVMPDQLTAALYHDSAKQEWGAIICDYGSSRKAWGLWKVIDLTLGSVARNGKATVQGTTGFDFSDNKDRILVFSKGPYIVMVMGPAADPVEKLVQLGNALQL